MKATPQEQMERLKVAERAVVIQDLDRMTRSQQALTDHYHKRMLGVPVPEEEMIHIGDVTTNHAHPTVGRPGMSKLAALALGLLGASVPAAGLIGYLLATAKPAVEKIIEKPGQDYDVDVGMEIIPPKK